MFTKEELNKIIEKIEAPSGWKHMASGGFETHVGSIKFTLELSQDAYRGGLLRIFPSTNEEQIVVTDNEIYSMKGNYRLSQLHSSLMNTLVIAPALKKQREIKNSLLHELGIVPTPEATQEN